MKNTVLLVVCVLLAGWIQPAQAQSISPAWDAYRKAQRAAASRPQATAAAPATAGSQPAAVRVVVPAQAQARTQAQVQPQLQAVQTAQAPVAYIPPAPRKKRESGFFLGSQMGKGRVYEDVDQTVATFHAGYRWQAGAVSLVGFELGAGRLVAKEEQDIWFPSIRYLNLGANARFNFGEGNPWFALARLGYWRTEGGEGVDGAYASFGLGMDLDRHTSLSLMYTRYAYATATSFGGYYYGTTVNSADTLTLGVEARF